MLQRVEIRVKFLLERFPLFKKMIKRAYQFFFCIITNSWNMKKGKITKATPDDGFEYFCGYYDKSPFDATDRYMLVHKSQNTYADVAPQTPVELCVIDNLSNKLIFISYVFSWNNQQGCMAQWMGPDFSSKIIYNDFREGKYVSVIYDWVSKREEKILSAPIYDVSKDGKIALTLDFSRLHRLRPGYGYSNLQDCTSGQKCPDQYCMWKIDIVSGDVTGLIKYTDLYNFEHVESMDHAEHKINHIMINPSGDRFMFIHRWLRKGKKYSRLITADINGNNLYNLSDDTYVSHCFWKNNDVIISFLRKNRNGDHYYILNDLSQEHHMIWPMLKTDGHCSYSHDKKYIVTDTYPNRSRVSTVYMSREDEEPKILAQLYSPFKYDNEYRCDLHPRWNFKDNKICFDSVCEGKRAVYYVEI